MMAGQAIAQGIRERRNIKWAEAIQKEQAQLRQAQLEQVALQNDELRRRAANAPMEDARRQSMALLEQAVMANKIHAQNKPLSGPEDLGNGLVRIDTGNGTAVVKDIRPKEPEGRQPPQFYTIEGPDGQPISVLVGGSLGNAIGPDGKPLNQRPSMLEDMINLGVVDAPHKQAKGAPPKSGGGLPTIQTEEEFNALPSGAEFIDAEDGKRYRKP